MLLLPKINHVFLFLKSRNSALLLVMLGVGLFIQITGKVWLTSGSARNSQIYIWLLLPTLFVVFYSLFKRRNLGLDLYCLPWAAFLVWVALSTLWSTGSDTEAFSLAKRGFFIALYILAVQLLYSKGEMHFRRALQLSVLMVAIGALASLVYQYGFLGKPFAYRAFRIDRLGYGDIADYGWPVAAGIFHGAIATWALGFALNRGTSLRSYLLWLGCFAILALYVLLTYTRGALIAMAISTLVAVLFNNTRRGWGIVAAGMFLGGAGAIYWWDKLVYEVLHRQLSGRGPIWEYFYSSMQGKWLIGHGLGTPFHYKWPGQDAVSPHAHSLYLQQIYDSGLLALFFLIVGVISIFYKSWTLRGEAWVQLALPAFIFALISMLTDVERIFTRPSDYWTMFWLPVAVLLTVKASKTTVSVNSC